MLRQRYEAEDWNWKCRVAFTFILGHLVVLILPFFSVIFLLMDILEDGSGTGKGPRLDDPFQAFVEGSILILLIGVFFSEMISMFASPFGKLVMAEVFLLITFFFASSFQSKVSMFSHVMPAAVICSCALIKILCACWSNDVEKVRKNLLKRGPGKIV